MQILGHIRPANGDQRIRKDTAHIGSGLERQLGIPGIGSEGHHIGPVILHRLMHFLELAKLMNGDGITETMFQISRHETHTNRHRITDIPIVGILQISEENAHVSYLVSYRAKA